MSLIESAIEKMRRTRYDANVKPAQTAHPESPPPGTSRFAAPAPLTAPMKQFTLDLEKLRAAGYLPDTTCARMFEDQYRQIKRPLIEKALSDRAAPQLRLIMVTSALAGDGKTFTSINLALSMARERDTSVLLIDADLAKRKASCAFGVGGEHGLLDALGHEAVDVGSLILATGIPGFNILPAGTPMDHASELIASSRMVQIAAQISANDRSLVVLDSAPVLGSTEAGALAHLAGQIVLVARSNKTPRQALLDAIGQLDATKLSGIVVNDSKADPSRYNYGYGSYGTQSRDSGTVS